MNQRAVGWNLQVGQDVVAALQRGIERRGHKMRIAALVTLFFNYLLTYQTFHGVLVSKAILITSFRTF